MGQPWSSISKCASQIQGGEGVCLPTAACCRSLAVGCVNPSWAPNSNPGQEGGGSEAPTPPAWAGWGDAWTLWCCWESEPVQNLREEREGLHTLGKNYVPPAHPAWLQLCSEVSPGKLHTDRAQSSSASPCPVPLPSGDKPKEMSQRGRGSRVGGHRHPLFLPHSALTPFRTFLSQIWG